MNIRKLYGRFVKKEIPFNHFQVVFEAFLFKRSYQEKKQIVEHLRQMIKVLPAVPVNEEFRFSFNKYMADLDKWLHRNSKANLRREGKWRGADYEEETNAKIPH